MNCRQNFSPCRNNASFNNLITSVDNSLGLPFKSQKDYAVSRKPQAKWTTLRSFFWFTVEKRSFPRHGDLNNASWISTTSQNVADVFQFLLEPTPRTNHQCSMHKCPNQAGPTFCKSKRIPTKALSGQ